MYDDPVMITVGSGDDHMIRSAKRRRIANGTRTTRTRSGRRTIRCGKFGPFFCAEPPGRKNRRTHIHVGRVHLQHRVTWCGSQRTIIVLFFEAFRVVPNTQLLSMGYKSFRNCLWGKREKQHTRRSDTHLSLQPLRHSSLSGAKGCGGLRDEGPGAGAGRGAGGGGGGGEGSGGSPPLSLSSLPSVAPTLLSPSLRCKGMRRPPGRRIRSGSWTRSGPGFGV